jgi:hypothetical protein
MHVSAEFALGASGLASATARRSQWAMPLPLAELRALLEAGERIGQLPFWDTVSDPNWTQFTTPLIVGDAVPEGLQLRGSALKRCWDRNVTFQLEVAPAGRKARPFYRIDWRPLTPHTNHQGPPELRFEVIAGSHEHRLEDNCVEHEDRNADGNLPTARPIEPEPETYERLLAWLRNGLGSPT